MTSPSITTVTEQQVQIIRQKLFRAAVINSVTGQCSTVVHTIIIRLWTLDLTGSLSRSLQKLTNTSSRSNSLEHTSPCVEHSTRVCELCCRTVIEYSVLLLYDLEHLTSGQGSHLPFILSHQTRGLCKSNVCFLSSTKRRRFCAFDSQRLCKPNVCTRVQTYEDLAGKRGEGGGVGSIIYMQHSTMIMIRWKLLQAPGPGDFWVDTHTKLKLHSRKITITEWPDHISHSHAAVVRRRNTLRILKSIIVVHSCLVSWRWDRLMCAKCSLK